MRSIAAAVAIALVAMTAACSKPQQPKVDLAKPIQDAKKLEGDLIKKAQDDLKKADEQSR